MFTALAEEDYRYDSSTYLQKAGWDLLNGIAYTPQEITSERFASLQMPAVMKELPLTAEYTWYLQQEKFAQALALAIHDYGACMNAGIPFVPLCHVAPLQEGDPGLGFALYQELLGHMAQSGTPAESLTLGEITDTFTAPCGASGTESTHETQFQRQNQRMETNRHGG